MENLVIGCLELAGVCIVGILLILWCDYADRKQRTAIFGLRFFEAMTQK